MKRLLNLALLVFLLIFLPVYVYYSGSRHFEAYAAILDLLLVLLAAICYWTAAFAATDGSDRVWFRISVGLFVWCIAICFRLCEMALNVAGYGSIADGFWVVGCLPLGLGAYLWFCSATSDRPRLRLVLVLAGVSAGILVLAIVWPLISNPTRPALLKALDLFYPALDLLLVILLIPPALQKDAWGGGFLSTAFVLLLVSDLLFSYYGNNPTSRIYRYLDVPYTAGYFLLAMAGYAQRMMLRSHQT
jgi:hypothetical protein